MVPLCQSQTIPWAGISLAQQAVLLRHNAKGVAQGKQFLGFTGRSKAAIALHMHEMRQLANTSKALQAGQASRMNKERKEQKMNINI